MIGRVCHLLRMQPPVVDNRGLLYGSGTTVPTDGTDGWQTGAIFQKTDGGAGTALYLNEGSVTSSAFKAVEAGSYTGAFTIAPTGTGTYLDFQLETEWVSGTLIRADFGSSTTLTGSVIGIGLDLGANIVATSEQSVKGVDINLPQMTMTAASPSLIGVEVTAAGAFTLDTSGTAVFTGVDVTTPAITQTAGTVTSTAFKATGGTLTSGSAYGLVVGGAFTTGVDVTAATTTGLLVSGASTTGVQVSGASVQAFKAEYNVGSQLGAWVHGVKVELTRTANIQPATGGWFGGQFVLNAGSSGYAALNKGTYALQAVFKGSDTNPNGTDIHVARFETQSAGKVSDICYITANSGTTIVGSLLYLATHVAPGNSMALLNVQSSQTVARGLAFLAGSGSTLTSLLYCSGDGTFTNFLEVAASGDGGVTVGTTDITGDQTADAYLTIKIGSNSYKVLAWSA